MSLLTSSLTKTLESLRKLTIDPPPRSIDPTLILNQENILALPTGFKSDMIRKLESCLHALKNDDTSKALVERTTSAEDVEDVFEENKSLLVADR